MGALTKAELAEHLHTELGLSKRELLKHTVLPSLATNRALQRLLAEYLETLEATL